MTTRVALVTPDTWLVLNDSDVVIGTIALNVSGFIAITLRAIAAITTRLPT